MSCTRLAILVLAALALAAVGCGGSSKKTISQASASQPASGGESSASAGPLTRAQLIAKGDAICYRLNVKRSSIRISTHSDYERLVPPLAAEELAAAVEMSKLTPPPSMAHDWQQMVTGSHTIAAVTGHYRTFTNASNDKKSRTLDVILGNGIDQLTHAAKRSGFKDCAKFE